MNARNPEVAEKVTRARWGGKLKYPPNSRIDAAIEVAYTLYREHGSRTAIKDLAARIHWPKSTVKQRARKLGLTATKEPFWSAEEEAILERVGYLSDGQIQKHLAAAGYTRSVTAIHLKIKRLRIKPNLDGYSARTLAEALGEDVHKITKWIHLGMLSASKRGTERERDIYWIAHSDVKRFVTAYPGEIRLARVEKWWFLDLVSEGAVSERSAELTRLRSEVAALIAAAGEAAKLEAQRRKLINEKEREVSKAMQAARDATAEAAVQKPRRLAIRAELTRLHKAIAQLQGRRMTREATVELQNMLDRLVAVLNLPAGAAVAANSVDAFLLDVAHLGAPQSSIAPSDDGLDKASGPGIDPRSES